MVEHQAPPFPKLENDGEGNELILEETDHDLARKTLAAEEIENDQVPSEPLNEPLEETVTSVESEALASVESETVDTEIPNGSSNGWELTQSLRSEDAINFLHDELDREPENDELKKVAAISMQRVGNFDTAAGILGELVEKYPKDLSLRQRYAVNLMNKGDWEKGLLELELSRGELSPLQSEFCQDISRLWTGQSLMGKHIVVVGNGSQTDQIQFARYINQLSKLRPSKIGYVCDQELVSVMRSLSEINRVDSQMFEPFDYFIPVESLPLRLDASPEDIQKTPYLHANDHRAEAKKAKLKSGKPLLGLCWRDQQPEGVDCDDVEYHKLADSFDLEPLEWHLRELAMTYDIVAFQPDVTDAERRILASCGCRVIEPTEFKDLSTIAEWLTCMDELVTVDSPISHLAGALGLEARVLFPYTPDWKGEIENGHSKWYPTLKVHQKQSEDCWRQAIAEALKDLNTAEIPLQFRQAS